MVRAARIELAASDLASLRSDPVELHPHFLVQEVGVEPTTTNV